MKKSDSNGELDFGEEDVSDNQINKNSNVRTSRQSNLVSKTVDQKVPDPQKILSREYIPQS